MSQDDSLVQAGTDPEGRESACQAEEKIQGVEESRTGADDAPPDAAAESERGS